jgi:glutamate-1-semialdehyde 2,1-aminomutase
VTAVPPPPATQAVPSPPATGTLVARAERLFPGGVNSPVRAFRAVGRAPLFLTRGEGPYVWDADGRRFIDYIGSWGAAILGHAHPAIVEAVRSTVANGLAFGATHPLEIELGEAIQSAMPSMQRLRFTSSGTEAVASALRVARAATGRDLVVKFAGAYHGHSDGMLADAGSGLATLGIAGSLGVSAAVAETSIVLPFNRPDAVATAFERHPDRIAAVIAEPVIANSGVIQPAPDFLEQLRGLCTAHGTLLVLDEVITGFRLGTGGAQARFAVEPDLTTLGKVIGGGMPIGAYGGRTALMELVAPSGGVYQAGTLSGHPLAMAAGLAAVQALTSDVYEFLEAQSTALAEGLRAAAAGAGGAASVVQAGPMLTVFFRPTPPQDGTEAQACDRDAYARFFGAMLDAGVLLPPSQFEAWFPSAAHSAIEIERTVSAAADAFRHVAR